MQVKDVMTDHLVKIAPQESVAVAARTLAQYNIGVLPVCRENGTLCGLVTDRDLVTRCVAAGLNAAETPVGTVMTRQLVSVPPQMETESAAALMGIKQVRRLPVVENGKLCGMISLGDIASRPENNFFGMDALSGISSNITEKKA